MGSFDAVSPFTNVSVSLAPEIIRERWSDVKEFTRLIEEIFFEALELCLENVYRKFDGTYYSQVQGIATGSPLSPIVCS